MNLEYKENYIKPQVYTLWRREEGKEGKEESIKGGEKNQETSIEIKLIKFATFICVTIEGNVFMEGFFCFVLALQAKARNST